MIFHASAIKTVFIGEKYSTDLSKNVTKPAHANIAHIAYRSDFLHCDIFIDRISSKWNERKNIHQIISRKNKPWDNDIFSHKTKTDTNTVRMGYALAILEDIPAYPVCKLLE